MVISNDLLPRLKWAAGTPPSQVKGDRYRTESAFCMKVILAPTDLSVESRQALNHAIYLAELVGAQLTLVHFYDESRPQISQRGSRGYDSMLKEERALQNKLYALRDEIRTVYRNCSSHFYIGNPIKEIPKVAKELRANLIVISTHDPHGAFSQMFRSDAEKILCHAPCPVLIVRQESSVARSSVRAGYGARQRRATLSSRNRSLTRRFADLPKPVPSSRW
jgi:universal stress protein A